MQLPLIQLLGLATGTVGIIQKAFGQGNTKGSFDAQLTSALEGKTGSKNLVSQLLAKKGGVDDEAFQSLLTVPAGVLLFQFMTSLRQMGVQASDIQLLMTGNGAQISDDSLKALLSQLGIGRKDLDALLADPQAMSDIKAQLSESFKTIIDEQALQDGIDPDALRELVVSDSKTIDEVIKRLEPGNSLSQNQAALSDEALSVGQHAPGAAAIMAGLIQRNVSHTANEIRAALAQIVKKAAISGPAQTGSHPEDQNIQQVSKVASTAENTLGISKDILKDLFFETDPGLRQQAVAQVTEQVNAYLKSQEGKVLSPEVKEALSFLKTAMSEQEFSGIDTSLKLLNQAQAVHDTRLTVDKEMYAALSKHLSSNTQSEVFENHMRQVIDQLRQTLPSHMRNGEGQVTLRLHPPMLGQVDVSMTMQDGELQAVFRTDQGITRDILLQNISILKDALADQGIKATQFSVSTTFDNRPSHSGLAFASQERHGHGHQGRGSENQGRSFREDDGTMYPQANLSGLTEGGLDLFA